MKTLHQIHISLGSNIGDRLAYLQKAIGHIYETIGAIVNISNVYQTPAWGFHSDPFFNACIAIETRLSTSQVLSVLLEIEEKLGRQRNDSEGYEARTIDLDILFSSEGILDTDQLQVPHPLVQERRFVLVPLVDIAADMVHPLLKRTVKELLQETKDTSEILQLEAVLSHPKDRYTFPNAIAIEGNIGAGKTSLATLIAKEFDIELMKERFKDNPFLPKFYENKERYAFSLEMSFLADRYQHVLEAMDRSTLRPLVSDYTMFKSLLFAEITLSKEEFELYRQFFDMMFQNLAHHDVYIYLYQNPSRLLQNIKSRGRAYEQSIAMAYLEKIQDGYERFITSRPELPICRIDISNLDFVNNRKDYIWVLQEIQNYVTLRSSK